jgi:hypothetical protein
MRDITVCHPRLQTLTAQLVDKCAGAGLPIKIGESFRSVAEQDALYAQGRTQPGSIVTNAKGSSYSSQHQWGIAADFYRADGKGAYNEAGDYFKRVGEIAKQLGLAWGGDWKSIIDKPHVYLPDWGSGTGILKQKYGTFENFKKTWAAEDGAAASQPSAPQVSITDLKEVKSGMRGLCILASPTLIIRTIPGGTDSGRRYNNGEHVQPLRKCFVNGKPWIETSLGWISGEYVGGWIWQDGRWWYVLKGYKYLHDTVCRIDGQLYAFDSDGWMLTADRIAEDGHIIKA